MWCLFPPIGTCFLVCKDLLLADTKGRLYCFFLHQTQSKRDGNVRKKAWRTLFIVNLVLDVPSRPPSQEVGHGGGLVASYTRTSTDSDSSFVLVYLDLLRLGPDSFSLINPQQSV